MLRFPPTTIGVGLRRGVLVAAGEAFGVGVGVEVAGRGVWLFDTFAAAGVAAGVATAVAVDSKLIAPAFQI